MSLFLQAQQCAAAGQWAEALALLANEDAHDAAVWGLRGSLLRRLGRMAEARQALQEAARLAPENFAWWANLAAVLGGVGAVTEAETAMQRALTLNPHPELLYNLGTLRLGWGDSSGAILCFREVLRVQPQHARAQLNLGSALREQGSLAEAQGWLQGAMQSPETALDAKWNLALLLLQQEKWEEGWRLYEARRQIRGFAMDRFRLPPWTGQRGSRVLIHAEQGLGDTFQFIRFLPLLREHVSSLILRVQDPLKPLLQGVAGADRVLGRQDVLPEVDAEIPLMSLPFLLKSWPPPPPPYLKHPLGPLASFGPGAVGLGWQGNPAYKADHLRSLPFNKVQKLFELPQIRWISLQKGLSMEALAPWPTVMDFGGTADLQKPFEDTARAILSLDRVITSDTALAHLAGALGAEVWLLLAYTPDWRWPLQGMQSIWYPRMRLFRQPVPGDWERVIHAVGAALLETLPRNP